jgi:hypothetical protein
MGGKVRIVEKIELFVDLLVIIVSCDGKFSVSSSAKEQTGSKKEKNLLF